MRIYANGLHIFVGLTTRSVHVGAEIGCSEVGCSCSRAYGSTFLEVQFASPLGHGSLVQVTSLEVHTTTV